MGLQQRLGLRRPSEWDSRTPLDHLLNSPLEIIAVWIYWVVIWLRGNPVQSPRNKKAIKIVCLSDTHDGIVDSVPEGDLLIHAGDLTNSGTAAAIQKQVDWLASLGHKHKVLIGGNHDCHLDKSWRYRDKSASLDLKGIKLLDSGSKDINTEPIVLEFDEGRKLTIWGSSMLPRCGPESNNAFMYDVGSDPWNEAVPRGTEILVTHTPPAFHMDLGLGCPSLLKEIWRVQPKLHIFGHVHCGRGVQPVYWDDCQRAYERLQGRQPWVIGKLPKGLTKLLPRAIIDFVPSYRWIDTTKVLVYGLKSLIWHFLWQGGRVIGNTGLMVNAGCQDGNKGRLTKKSPFVIEI
ncbi:putative Calcineurin-like phosphoesterase [Seiridium cardinale]|uniref:Calcineurin-like phosphoesterase n=1 Tax=Seiridium cardinale TaxID=138064 RepID=A0ABR2XS35_9PEZI